MGGQLETVGERAGGLQLGVMVVEMQRYGDCLVSRTGQVRCAVCDERARSRHADTEQVVNAEAQRVCPVTSRCGRRGTVLRVPG